MQASEGQDSDSGDERDDAAASGHQGSPWRLAAVEK
jgi:hypothetical protein